jgi:hypothetical protein
MTLLLNKLAPPALRLGRGSAGGRTNRKRKKKLPSHLVRRRELEQGCRGTIVSVVIPVPSVIVGQPRPVAVVPIFAVIPSLSFLSLLPPGCSPCISSTPHPSYEQLLAAVGADAESSSSPRVVLVLIVASIVVLRLCSLMAVSTRYPPCEQWLTAVTGHPSGVEG